MNWGLLAGALLIATPTMFSISDTSVTKNDIANSDDDNDGTGKNGDDLVR